MDAYFVEISHHSDLKETKRWIVNANSINEALDKSLRKFKELFPNEDIPEVHAKIIDRELI